MRFTDFKRQFKDNEIIDVQNVLNYFGDIDRRRLYEWQKKDYIKKITNNYYIFSESEINDSLLKITANRIYTPSYIGLESALSYYKLIPEAVFKTISITTRKTKAFKTDIAFFDFRTIHRRLFWGYTLKNKNSHPFLISDLEKTLLDYLYFNPHLVTEADFKELRLNGEEIRRLIDIPRLEAYLKLFTNQRVTKAIHKLLGVIDVKL